MAARRWELRSGREWGAKKRSSWRIGDKRVLWGKYPWCLGNTRSELPATISILGLTGRESVPEKTNKPGGAADKGGDEKMKPWWGLCGGGVFQKEMGPSKAGGGVGVGW